jgi:6-phosphogluconolactonase (cycloisomerase 2 family)
MEKHFKQKVGDEIVVAEPEFTATPPGSGPRHLAIDEARELVYVLHELKSLIEIYNINPATGELTLMSAVDLLAESPIPPEVWNHPFQVQFSI